MTEATQSEASPEETIGESLSGDESLMDPSVILQTINGTNSKERVIKRQRRGNRMKVYDNGYIFTYDKDSQSGERSFWRCERKSECSARVHTNPFTNQIIKRINEHSHSAPNREDLPPWLVLNETKSEIPDEHQHRKDGTTGVLINANFSTNSQLAKIIERELDGNEESTPPAEVLSPVEMASSLIKTEPEVESSPPKKKKKTAKKEEQTNEEIESLPDFDNLVKLTKKLLQFVRNGLIFSENSPQSSSSGLSEFLETSNLQEYNNLLSKFTMETLRLLPLADCISLLKSEADGLLLFHSLRSFNSELPSTSSQLSIFVSEMPSCTDEEPLYQMISLKEKTPSELRLELESLGLLQKDHKICVEGPNKIKVELNNRVETKKSRKKPFQMISTWPTESIFQLLKVKNMCLFKKIS